MNPPLMTGRCLRAKTLPGICCRDDYMTAQACGTRLCSSVDYRSAPSCSEKRKMSLAYRTLSTSPSYIFLSRLILIPGVSEDLWCASVALSISTVQSCLNATCRFKGYPAGHSPVTLPLRTDHVLAASPFALRTHLLKLGLRQRCSRTAPSTFVPDRSILLT